MRFREDILRGLRLGAILLAMFIAGVASYRMTREGPAGKPDSRSPASKLKPVAAAGPEGTGTAPGIVTPRAAARANRAKGPGVPPPPPSMAHKLAPRHPTAIAVIPRPLAAEAKSGESTDIVPAQPDVSVAADPEKDDRATAAGPPTVAQGDSNAAPATADQDGPKPPGRAKRALKAVGRFLRFGKLPE